MLMKEIDLIEFVNYTKKEEILNSVTHIIGAILTLIATVMCTIRSLSLERIDYLIIGLVYCLSMLIVFTCSSIYHGLPKAKKVMRLIDYTAINLMIMGTITPYMLLSVAEINYTLGWLLFTICLFATVISITLTLTSFTKTKSIRMVLYIVIALCAFSSIFVIGDQVSPEGKRLVYLGNIAYALGLIPFTIGAKKQYFHAIFHLLVIIGAAIHFVNLYLYVFV